MKTTLFVTLGCSALAFGAGLWLGRSRDEPAPAAASVAIGAAVDESGEPSRLDRVEPLPRFSAVATPLEAMNVERRLVSAFDLPAGPQRDLALQNALRDLARTDPRAAWALALRWTEDDPRLEVFLTPVIEVWVQGDPMECLVRVQEMARKNTAGDGVAALFAGELSRQGTTAVLKVIAALEPVDPMKAMMADAMMNRLCAAGEFVNAQGFVDRLKAGPAREGALARLALQWSEYDPRQVAQWLGQNTHDGDYGEALGVFVENWTSRDPATGLDWVAGLIESPARSAAIARGLKNWFYQDMLSATEWLAQRMDGSTSFDAAIAEVALEPDLLDADPDLAAIWVESIHDPELRFTSLRRVVSYWREIDPAAARSYIRDAAYLTPRERIELSRN